MARGMCIVEPGMFHELALKWELPVCGDHEMTLQYACGTPMFFHPFVHRDSAALFSSLLVYPFLFLSLSLSYVHSLSLLSSNMLSNRAVTLLVSAGSLSILCPFPLSLSLSSSLFVTTVHDIARFHSHTFSRTPPSPPPHFHMALLYQLPGNRDFPSQYQRPT